MGRELAFLCDLALQRGDYSRARALLDNPPALSGTPGDRCDEQVVGVIEIENVSKTFRDGTTAVSDLSLTAPSGKITVN